MRRRNASILTAASVVGVGVSVWTLATTEPVDTARRDQNPRERVMAATHEAVQNPQIIGSWTSGSGVGRALLVMRREAGVEDPVRWWMDEAAPTSLLDEAGEAMATYGWGVAISRTGGGYERSEVQQKMRAVVEMLEARAEERPEDMRYWQWNTLGFAHLRVRQFDDAAAALRRTQQAISDMAPSAEFADFWRAVTRLNGAWDVVLEHSGREASAFGNPQRALWLTVLNEMEERGEMAPRLGSSGPAWLPVASVLIESGEISAARRALANLRRQLMAEAREGRLDSAWPQAARVWMRLGDADRAHEALREVATFAASSETVEEVGWRTWWRVFRLLRDFYDRQAALDALQAHRDYVERRLPNAPGRWRDLGEEYASLGAVPDAIACFHRLDQAIREQDARDAQRAIEEHLNPVGWFCRHLGREDLAQEAWRRWLQVKEGVARDARGARRPVAWYNVACGRALLGEISSALDALEKSVEMGYRDAAHALADRDLETVRAEPRFAELIDRMRGAPETSRALQVETSAPRIRSLSGR